MGDEVFIVDASRRDADGMLRKPMYITAPAVLGSFPMAMIDKKT